MTGSLQVKNGKYYIVLNIYENGKRKIKWISTNLDAKGNKRNAEKLLRETLLKYEHTPQTVKSDVLFSEYIRLWLDVAKRRVDAVTYQGYEILSKTHVLPYFDKSRVKLQDVTRDILQAYFDEKAQHGRKADEEGLDVPEHGAGGAVQQAV